MASSFIYLDGKYIPESDPVFHIQNRAFRYGDSIFETMRIVNGRLCFWPDHFKRLKKGAALLGYEIDEQFSEENISDAIRTLFDKNEIKSDARVRLTVFRKDGGYYSPETNNISMALEVEPMTEEGYALNVKGLTVDIFSDYKKIRNSLSAIKNGNSIIYVLAGVYKTKNNLDDCILVNDNGNIIEAINSNIFAVKNGVLYTPPIEDGCVNGVMRSQVLKIAEQSRIAVYEIELKMNVLLNSDEVFFTNAVSGIRWVGAYKAKRYFNNSAKFFIEKLNQFVLEKI